MVDLVYEGVLPADHVPLGPPPFQKGWSASETRIVRNPSLPVRLQLFSRSRSKASEPFEPLISQLKRVLSSRANREASIVPPRLRRTHHGFERIVDLAPREKVRVVGGDRLDLADEIARKVDHVGAEVAERTGSGGVGVKAPRVVGRRAPLLQVPAAEVLDLAQPAGLDHLPREPHCGDEAVVECHHVLHPGRGDPLPDLVALVRCASERLLAEHVLAASAAAIVGSACRLFGPLLSNSSTSWSATSSRQSLT